MRLFAVLAMVVWSLGCLVVGTSPEMLMLGYIWWALYLILHRLDEIWGVL